MISPYYDSLLVKVTTWDNTFAGVCRKAARAINEVHVRGVKTNIAFITNILKNPTFIAGGCHTKFIDETPELFQLGESQDRATKMLKYIGNIVVKERDGHKFYEAPRFPPVTGNRPDGLKQLLDAKGPKAVADWVLAQKKLLITDTTCRDAHQSLLATRMTMDEMRPILPEMDKINYFSVECWGGATFDSCIRFLDEDPWERLRILRKELPHQKLQMLFRGQNMLGYRPYADDAVEYFVKKSVANGIDVIRIFDALNDARNLQTAIKSANKEGAHVQGCISYTLSPVHNNEYYVKYAKTLEEMGANSICIKDMAGLLTPYTCYELVKELKNTLSIPVDIHSHYTAGLASMSLLKGIEAGADIVDTAMSPLSGGTSHMATESLVAALQGTDYDTGLDLKQLNVVRAYFAKLREKYIANGQISPKSLGVDANTLLYQVPGGMFSNMLKQLKDAGKEDKLDEVLAEIPRVREDAGYPPLVTPTSQIVGTQAVFNVILGERYKMVTKEFKGLVHGDYGKTPAPISAEFTKKILGDEQPITCRFADTLAPEMDKLKAEAAKWAIQEEDVLTYAMFPQVAPQFFEKRNAKAQGVDADHADFANRSHPV